MGANEDHLKTILNDDAFRINELKALKGSLDELSDSLRTLTEPGWEGTSAEAAVGLFDELATSFTEVSGLVAQIETAIDGANEARITAENKMAKLPSAEVDSFWKDLVGQGQPIKFQIWQLPAESALNFIEEHMAADREKEAGLILDDLRSSLADQTTTLNTLRKDTTLEKFEAIEPDPPQPSGDIPTYAPQYPAGKLGGKPYTPPELEGKIWEQPPRPPKVDPPVLVTPPRPPIFEPPIAICEIGDPNVDDGGTGTIPGPGTGTGTGGTTGGGGGGMLPGLLGGGAGAAAIGVGARLAGSGFGGLGGGGLGGGLGAGGMTSGGLLGGSSPAAAAGARGGAVAGAAGGGRGNTAMMGGGGGAASEKEKRSGLGGIIAPRLEDEDDASPRSAGAGAGGRDQPSE